MPELLTLLAIYYKCTALANAGLLSQPDRFDCNRTYQQAKMFFVEDPGPASGAPLTAEENTRAYLRFKAWEIENPDLVRRLKGEGRP